MEDKIYCTSYCNFGHSLLDGKPIGHECYIIPPKALEAERAGDTAKAIEIMASEWPIRHTGKRLPRR